MEVNMPLFRIRDKKVNKVDSCEFSDELELEKFIEDNLEVLTGIRLLERQYPIPNGRIDTLGIDEDSIPVVIEYKWKQDPNAIIQGLFYLDWIKQNKRTIELVAKEEFGDKIKVNWNMEPRLIIIAKAFNDKELVAINQVKPSIELKKYSYYGDLFIIEDVNVVNTTQKRSIYTMKESKQGRIIKEYTINNLLEKTNSKIKSLFEKLREQILAISDEVWEKVGSTYCDYRTTSTFTSVTLQKDVLKVFVKMGDKKVNDPKKITRPIPKEYYGRLNTQFKIHSLDEINYAMALIKQAYKYVT